MRPCAQLWRTLAPAAVLLALATVRPVEAQQADPSAPLPGPAVGQTAPDFTLPGASRYGLLRTPVRLSDYRGETVVLAFFYKARTKG
jgi:peroxiredoxin Q/BCP